MLKKFDYFALFCIEHGHYLDHHKQFGEMVTELRAELSEADNILSTLEELQDLLNEKRKELHVRTRFER